MQKYMQKYQEVVALLPLKNWSLALLIINLSTILVITLIRGILPPVVPLFYGKPYGLEQLAPQGSLILPALSALGMSGLSIVVSIATGDNFLKKVLFGGMVVATILSLVTTIKIIFLVGNL